VVSVFRHITEYKLGDFLVENQACSSWTILVADKSANFCVIDDRFFVGRFYWQMKLANFIVHLTSP